MFVISVLCNCCEYEQETLEKYYCVCVCETFETLGLSANPILFSVFNGGLSVSELKVCGRSLIDGQDCYSKELLSAPAEREPLVRFDSVSVQ